MHVMFNLLHGNKLYLSITQQKLHLFTFPYFEGTIISYPVSFNLQVIYSYLSLSTDEMSCQIFLKYCIASVILLNLPSHSYSTTTENENLKDVEKLPISNEIDSSADSKKDKDLLNDDSVTVSVNNEEEHCPELTDEEKRWLRAVRQCSCW